VQQLELTLLISLLLRFHLPAWLLARGCRRLLVPRWRCAGRFCLVLLQRGKLPRPALAALHARRLATVAPPFLTAITRRRLVNLPSGP